MRGIYDAYKEAFRLWIRKRTRPMSIEEAEEKKLLWSKIYAGTSFILFCFLTFKAFDGSIKFSLREDLPKNVATGLLLHKGDTPMRFVTFRGFQKVEDFTFSNEEIQKLKEAPVGSLSKIPDGSTNFKKEECS